MSSLQVEASPQAGNFNWRKRHRQDSSGSESERKAPKLNWNYITLESESPLPSEEDTESVYSVQAHETEYCKDTSDTDWTNYSVDDGDILMQVEYEVDSDFDKSEKFVFGDGASSSGTEGVVETAVMVATLCDSDLALWADTEDSKSGYSTDSELGHADYWTCVRCKNKNNNPLFRYCEKCYQERKNFFPPRPKGRKKKRGVSRKSDGHRSTSSATADESVSTVPLKRELSQDSGVATSLSQESIDLMDLATIKIPDNLLKQTKFAPDISKPGNSSNQDDNQINRGSLVSVDLVRTDQKVVMYTRSEITDIKNDKIVLDSMKPGNSNNQDDNQFNRGSLVSVKSDCEITDIENKKLVLDKLKPGNSNNQDDDQFNRDSLVSVKSECEHTDDKNDKIVLDIIKPGKSNNQDDNQINRDSLVSVDLVRTEQKVVMYTKSECEITDNENDKVKNVKEKNIDVNKSCVVLKEDKSNLCITCMTQVKDAVFMHSGPLHMCCCYKCAMRVWTECKRCPMCNRKISNVRKVCVA